MCLCANPAALNLKPAGMFRHVESDAQRTAPVGSPDGQKIILTGPTLQTCIQAPSFTPELPHSAQGATESAITALLQFIKYFYDSVVDSRGFGSPHKLMEGEPHARPLPGKQLPAVHNADRL